MMSGMARLFVAVWPPDDVAESLRELRRKDERGVRFVAPENWHVTLRFLGDADPDAVGDALDRGTYTRCVARVGPGVDVLKHHSVIVPVRGVDPLAAAVARATRGLGTEPERRKFAGHLTLARMKRHARPPAVTGARIEGEFEVEEVALVESTLTASGAVYTTLETWPTA
jgi:2'-5' RNA ligase